MKQYKLLQTYSSPFTTIMKGVTKPIDHWVDIFECEPEDIEIKTDWFELVPVIGIDEIIKISMSGIPRDEITHDKIRSCVINVLKRIKQELMSDDFDSVLNTNARYTKPFEELPSENQHEREGLIWGYDDCKRDIRELLDEIIEE